MVAVEFARRGFRGSHLHFKHRSQLVNWRAPHANQYSGRLKQPLPYKERPELKSLAQAHSATSSKPSISPPDGGDLVSFTKRKRTTIFYIAIITGAVIVTSFVYLQYADPLRLENPTVAERDTLIKRENGITASSPMRLRMESLIKSEQQRIVNELERFDPTHRFRVDSWSRPNGGGGLSCVLQDGKVFEKAGVNTSVVYGTLPRPAVQKMRVNHKALDPDVESLEYFAAGLSCVLHPANPHAPTVHFNYRYFETMDKDGTCNAWWFGGGTDLTPSYLYDEDAIHFHQIIKGACDKHDKSYFSRFKIWCDKYFTIPHRKEARGIGGIFFDDLDEQEKDQEQLFSFVKDCLLAFLPSYMPLLEKRINTPFTSQEKEWQQLRRGRYVEFNLVHDRGTSFGLNTPGARVESVLMSLPLTARWIYMHEVEKGSREERLLKVLQEPRDWV
ncbi:uncharacterized protein KY384_000258 [Bacidia gigantensis]|uniref:uncharacterized protein n=1 Tax=Bacidia gigantensis TaxID=2732470 RepID=UPI001D03825D|nr:uncharacterized protein KY384_000258 [Bacidia gigantensis]KAG8526265.1 hypothetical protein KY384_000258 [Bacidia gigantensis]